MLIQLTIENFRSFRDRTTFSLRAAGNIDRARDAVDVTADTDILRCAAVYGANASGKSNLVAAIELARDLVCEGTAEGRRIQAQPFRLDPALRSRPTCIELYVRVHSGRVFGYGFGVTRERVLYEVMTEVGEAGETLIFRRDEGRYELAPGPRDRGPAEKALEFLLDTGRDNQLLLRTAKELTLERFPEPIQEITRWFEESLTIVKPDSIYGHLITDVAGDAEFRGFLGDILRETDTGVSAIRTRKYDATETERELWERGALGTRTKSEALVVQQGKERVCFIRDEDDKQYRLELRFAHQTGADASTELSLADESDGTVRLLDLAPLLHRLREGAGTRVFVVDELDRSVHTLLSRWLIEQFLGRGSGSASQLIFTTHDTNLLDLALLRPDSLWFAQKDASGSSHLYSLAEYKKEQIDALRGGLEDGYLSGRFGAIPFLGDHARLGSTPEGE